MAGSDDPFQGVTVEELTLSEIELTRALDQDGPVAAAQAPEQASSPTATAPAVGTPAFSQVGRYELLLEIASGGMATVYIGRQHGAGGFERLVAIKRMHPHVSAVPELAAAFMDEARIASLIRHPNVVNVHDVHESEGEHLLVMDYVDGPSLANVLKAARKRNERISRPAGIRILIDVLSGLHAAHELTNFDGIPLGVVHRDATPHNILLGTDGSVRLTDFGIAKAAERSVHTATGLAKGKFRYMAPEQARGGAMDRRVDIFAMGIVAWELLTGERLLRGESDAQVLLEITEGKFRSTRSVDSTIPDELDRIVMRALATDPNQRWPTAAALADALEGWARLQSELVSSAEVARLVHEFCGAAIVKRRKALTEVLQGSRPAAGFSAMRQTQSTGTGSTAGTSAPLTMDSVRIVPALSPEQIAAHRRKKQMIVGGIAAGVTLLAVGVLFMARAALGGHPDTEPGIAVIPNRSPPAPSASAPNPLSKQVKVVVTADDEVSEIRGPGVSDVQFTKGGAQLTLPRGEKPVTLVVRMSDGSEITETIVPNDNTAIRVRSVGNVVTPKDLPTAQPKHTHPTPHVGNPGTKPGGLEANPYE